MSKYIGTPVVNLSVDTVDVTGDITATDSTPELILLNDTHEDTDGGREGKVTFKGEQSGGEVTVLAQIQSGHDGTSDDQKGDLIFKTNDGSDGSSPTERMRIDSNGAVGIGVTPSTLGTVDASLQLSDAFLVHYSDNTTSLSNNVYFDGSNNVALTTGLSSQYYQNGGEHVWRNAASVSAGATATLTERMRIDTNGNLGVGGTAVPSASSYNSATIHARQVGSSSVGAQLRLTTGASGHALGDGSFIAQWADLDMYITNQENANINFTTNGAQRMSLATNGFLNQDHAFVATTGTGKTGFYSTGEGVGMYATNAYSSCGDHIEIGTDATAGWACMYFNRTQGVGEDERFVQFAVNGNVVGSISSNGSATTYATSSDYRLKENVETLSGAITRVKQLKPKRFSWILDERDDANIDGFLAHETQTVVPEAVFGEKDAVDDDNNPKYQGIDQAKLVPLLTAALQEAIAKIETLETKVAALEGE